MSPQRRNSRRYEVVDVFAKRAFEGNPLTVVLDAEGLTGRRMQQIARETNHSETTFILPRKRAQDAWPVRIFTPTVELPFAGHPTIGTAAVIHRLLRGSPDLEIALKIGKIPVKRSGKVYWMQHQAPRLLEPVDAQRMAECLGLRATDLDPLHPPQIATTGLPFHIVPLRSLAAARKARLDFKRFQASFEQKDLSVLVFAPETETSAADLHVRCFAEAYGIPEDPATGSAAGALAGWLHLTNYLGKPELDLTLEQGIEIGRPSSLRIRVTLHDGTPRVEVGGEVVPIASGRFQAV